MRCSEGFRLDQFLVGTDVIVAQTLDLRLILLRRGLIDPGHPEACCLGGADGVEGVLKYHGVPLVGLEPPHGHLVDVGAFRFVISRVGGGDDPPEIVVDARRFQGFFRLDGSLCLYLYDYCPVRRNDKITFEGKKISNLIFKFKSGQVTDLSVKLFSIAISRIRVIQENKHRAVLIPIPASTREKNRIRYQEFCRKLSADIGVADGYEAITLTADRPQLKGTHGKDKTANLDFHPEYFKDKCCLLIDDLLTTGEGFIQTKRKLIEHGAKFVIGLFLAKTIAFEDEQE